VAGWLAELLFLAYVLPFAAAFLWLVFLTPSPLTVSPTLEIGVVVAIVLAAVVVLTTATMGYLRAKHAAREAEPDKPSPDRA
jgi:hypothetical protein